MSGSAGRSGRDDDDVEMLDEEDRDAKSEYSTVAVDFTASSYRC